MVKSLVEQGSTWQLPIYQDRHLSLPGDPSALTGKPCDTYLLINQG